MTGFCLAKLCGKVSLLMIIIFCFVFSFRCSAGSATEESVKPLEAEGNPSSITKSSDSASVTASEKLILKAGKSTVVPSAVPVKRISAAVPEIADVTVITPQRICISGKAPGKTNIMLWDENDKLSNVFDLEVLPADSDTAESVKPRKRVLTADGSEYPSECINSSEVSEVKPRKLILTADKSTVVTSSGQVRRVSVAVPAIAEVMVLTPRQISITGKVPGTTNLMLWDENSKLSDVFVLEVVPDVNLLKEKLHDMFPYEENIQVRAVYNRLTLSGTVSSTATQSQILELAQGCAGEKGVINNFLEVGGVHQVMLEVRVSEMGRDLIRRLGFNFTFLSASGGQIGIHSIGGLTSTSFSAGDTNTVFSSAVNEIFRFMSGGATWTMFIDALKEHQMLKVLAEPTLITLSGKPASFLAGGEIPIPVPQAGAGIGVVTVEYHPFGVSLKFTPTVLSSGKINMQVAPEVSEPDFSNAVTTSGFTVPSFVTRRAATVIELADGQSFAIAGLLSNSTHQDVSKTPLLGDVPVLGALFRSTQFQRHETELIIVVTVHLVKPVNMAKQTLPTDKYVEPDDYEFYLLGIDQGLSHNEKLPYVKEISYTRGGGLEGDFGHINP